MPLLDTLEVWFVPKSQQRPLSPSAEKFVASSRWLTKWLSPPWPDRDLKATNFYSLSLYLRCAWAMVSRLSLSYTAFWVIGLIIIVLNLWHSYPILFHTGRGQARFWHGFLPSAGQMLVAKGFVLIPFVPLTWVLFGLLFYLLRALFWNRRARRLLAAGDTIHAGEAVVVAVLDASVWPPPPHH